MTTSQPSWFRSDQVMVCNAETCGISKSGALLPQFDDHGRPVMTTDPETGAPVPRVDDQLLDDITALVEGVETDRVTFVQSGDVDLRLAVPCYYDRRPVADFERMMERPELSSFAVKSLGELVESGEIFISNGHGSAPKDVREGEIPYIKVSDLRAGQVNINPTNHVPLPMARKFWRQDTSGLQEFDLISPERASKNIGDFCVLMPGQEEILLTKEVIIVRATPSAPFDQFYLIWALTLKEVRGQWDRVVFMQTNREDVGKRYLEVKIPVPPTRAEADRISKAFRSYFSSISHARRKLLDYLDEADAHHFFVGTTIRGKRLTKPAAT